ncbi:MAG: HAD hydrolase-like protein [Candidatus Neomarinimicrobiota bacterium]
MAAKKYQHIIWDWNGTLLDDAWLCVEVMNAVLGRREMPLLTSEKYREVFDFPVKEYYRRLGFDFARESFEVSGTEFIVGYEKRRHEARLRLDAKRTLAAVAELGITQSLLSAYKQETLDELTQDLGVRQFFLKVIGQDNHYAHGKTESGKRWINEMHCGAHEVLLVGDTVHDHEVAEAIGADCVLIPAGHHNREKLETCGVPVLDLLPDVVGFLTGEV